MTQIAPWSDGPYYIVNRLTQTVLDLTKGEWKYGVVQCWQEDEYRKQRWMVCRCPGNEDTYSIFNLFYGVSMGVFHDERNDTWICEVAPTALGSKNARWLWKNVGNFNLSSKYGNLAYGFFTWMPDRHRVLDLAGGRPQGNVLAWTENSPWRKQHLHPDLYLDSTHTVLSAEDAKNQHWGMITDSSLSSTDDPLTSWMFHVPGDTKLSMLNLVGTHQSLALHAVKSSELPSPFSGVFGLLDNPRCQNISPYEQLLAGVRVLDLRFDIWVDPHGSEPKALFARHGNEIKGVLGANEGYSFLAVLLSLKLFLANNPTETVIVNISNEASSNGNAREFFEAFDNDFGGFYHGSNIIYKKIANRSMPNLLLDDVRGKIVVVTDDLQGHNGEYDRDCFSHPDSFYGKDTHADDAKLHDQSAYDRPKDEWTRKLQDCKENIEKAQYRQSSDIVFRTSWNMSKAAGDGRYNPVDFAQEALVAASLAVPQVLNERRLGLGT